MGAHIIVNLSASDEIIGKAGYRRDLVRQQSGRLLCAYLYADAGFGESTQDLVFAGHDLIAENGAMLAESRMFEQGIIYADIDLQRLAHERQRMNTFEAVEGGVFSFSLAPAENDLADRTFPRTPFVPANKALRDERCEEILTLQATGLATRLRHTHAKTAVVGLSGGLDSTLALIVLVHAFDMLSLDRKGILAVTMPCFGTTARTKGNAEKLAEAYGVTLKTVDIKAAVDQHFEDIGQSKDDLSVTFENGQARMRTLVLMNLANKTGGMVVGTGDLSELALGWATYNGDHMSMYGVNGSIPKTLVRYLVAYEADRVQGEEKRYLMLYKPRGYVTTLKDERGRKTVADLVRGCGARVVPVGRLDYNSEGLLLLTNDGDLVNGLTHPRHEVEKHYEVRVRGNMDNIPRLSEPMELDGYAIRPAGVTVLERGEESAARRRTFPRS